MKTLMIVALCCAMSGAWAAQRQANLGVSVTIVPVACPAGVTAPSCAPFAQTVTAADSYVAASPAVAGGVPPTIEKIEGKVNIVTVTY